MTIIVGIDGSPVSRQVLTWAIAEGRLREMAVCAVYAWQGTPESIAGGIFGTRVSDTPLELGELQKHAERRLADAVAGLVEEGTVELRAVRGNAAEVLVEASRDADLLVVGSRGHGGFTSALIGSVSQACTHHAECPVVVIRDRESTQHRLPAWHPDEVIAREIAQNAQTWDALASLGVCEGTELVLEFVYETAGPAADRVLAEFLGGEGYEVEIEPVGVSGHTRPTPVSQAALDEWVTRMVLAGHEHGGCAFDGWTATLSGRLAHSDANAGRPLTPHQ
jgi:nucleotide-binding universal stress UspA family protein